MDRRPSTEDIDNDQNIYNSVAAVIGVFCAACASRRARKKSRKNGTCGLRARSRKRSRCEGHYQTSYCGSWQRVKRAISRRLTNSAIHRLRPIPNRRRTCRPSRHDPVRPAPAFRAQAGPLAFFRYGHFCSLSCPVPVQRLAIAAPILFKAFGVIKPAFSW
jgi:hypothetical protein